MYGNNLCMNKDLNLKEFQVFFDYKSVSFFKRKYNQNIMEFNYLIRKNQNFPGGGMKYNNKLTTICLQLI